MSQFLRIQGEVFHLPSVAHIHLYASAYIGRPFLRIVAHSGQEQTLRYGLSSWDVARNDFRKLEVARAACYEALKKVPLLEEDPCPNPLEESETPKRELR